MDFIPNPRAPEEIARSKDWARYVGTLAGLAAEAAKVSFEAQGPHPYSDEPEHYVDSLGSEVRLERGVIIGRVVTYSDYGWFIEVGTSDTPTFAPLQHGADMIGLRLEAKRG